MAMERGSLLNKRYRIVEILGQGGMAAVYRAIDENLGVEVAVKENLFTTEEYARQFRLEATILASLRHPNLPRVSDHFVIEQQGQYLIMDYIEGEDLRQRMDRLGALPEQEAIVIGVAICDALSYMHSRKPMVLHRDIKPGNVRITPTGHIYLVDFGLAKVVHGREATSTGARAMTPGYSPPEQYGTARTDQRSDIYSLGATLYSAMTDVLPEDALARAMNQATLTSLISHNPRISRQLAAVIEKCLEVRPDNRYQNAEELKQELMNARSTSRRKTPIELVLPPPPITLHERLPGDEEGSTEPPPGANKDALIAEGEKLIEEEMIRRTGGKAGVAVKQSKPEPRRKRRSGVWAIFLLLLILVVGGGVGYLLNPAWPDYVLGLMGAARTSAALGSAAQNTPSSTPAPPSATPQPSLTPTPTLSPTLTPTITPSPTITPLPTETFTPTPLPTPLGGGLGQIAFASDRNGSPDIYLVYLDGSGLIQLTDISEGACQPRWAPDGMRMVFISPCERDMDLYWGASMFIMNADGSNIVPLPSAPGGDYDPVWSPDGTRLAFVSLRNGLAPSIYVMNLADYTITALVEADNHANTHPYWSPDGTMIAYTAADGRIWAMNADGSNRHRLNIGGGDYRDTDPAWSPDGTVVVFSRVALNDPSGANWMMAVPFTVEGALSVEVPNSQLVSDISFSPDGFWLLFKSWFTGNHDIFIMRSNGVDRQPLVEDPAYDFDPSWRPGSVIP